MSDQFVVGDIATIIIPSPAPGANLTYMIPAGVRYKVRSIAFNLQTDANVANRRPIILITDPEGGVSYVAVSKALITSAIGTDIVFAPGVDSLSNIIATFITVPLSSELVLVPGEVLSSGIINIQATDQITEAYLLVERFILP